ncbi:MAG: tRNA (guanosine(37)-N1)-methyltransferase TrmD [Balneolaceae bacterium]
MLRIDLISAVPSLLDSPLSNSIIGRARAKGLVDIHIHDLRDYSEDKHRKIDDYPYGGGAGMVLSAQPVFSCIEKLTSERNYDEIIFTAPDGEKYDQRHANRLSVNKHLIFLCGHYKGVDQRVREQLVTREYSIGDFVLSGGEIPAVAITDSIVRLLPGALGDSESALTDSFQEPLLSAPVYTRPADFRGMKVPHVLTSGDHKKVENWRKEQAIQRTKRLRPDLFQKFNKESTAQ